MGGPVPRMETMGNHRNNQGAAQVFRGVDLRDPGAALLQLAKSAAIGNGDIEAAAREICEIAAAGNNTERTSVWLFNDRRDAIRCVNLFRRSYGRHVVGGELSAADYPAYFRALDEERTVAADDARTDPRTREFADSYLCPLGITSMLDVPIRAGGRMVGVMCLEHTGPRRVWTIDEQTLAGSMGDFMARAIEAAASRRTREALRRSEAKYRDLVERLPVVTYIAGRDVASVLYVSPQVETVLGFTPEEWQAGSPDLWLERIHPEDRERVVQQADECRRGGEPLSLEYRIQHRDGTIRWVRDAASNLPDRDGVERLVQGVMLDVTARKEAEESLRQRDEQLRQAQKMDAVGRLAGGIAHDFNNLLTAILGHADMAIEDIPSEHAAREDVDEIRRAGERAADLTAQLLAFSRKQVLKPQVVDTNAAIREMEALLRRLITEEIEMVTDLAPDAGRVHVDPGQLQQVVMNLAVNARDAMEGGGRLTLATANADLEAPLACHELEVPAGRYVMIAAIDTGTGIDDDTLSRMFEPFFTTKAVGKGTGLGLPMVYGIVAQSGGHLLVLSEPGHGTEFRVYLPRVEGPVGSHDGDEA